MVFRNERTWLNAVEAGAEDEFHRRFDAAIARVPKEFGATHPMYIAGEPVRSRRGTFADTCPANPSLVLGRFQRGTRADARRAVEAAKAAFPAWSRTPYAERARMHERAADLVAERKYDLAALMSFENGKNRLEAMADVDEAADLIRWYADEMVVNRGFERAMGMYTADEHATSVLRPYGVWAVIAPFNFPLAIAAGMSCGALVTGNTVVFKPASDTPFMGLKLYEALRDAGLPNGVLNYVTGPGSTVGQELVEHPGVDGFVFTGSRDVGLRAYRRFGRDGPRPIIAEMGGKNPTIVTATADLDAAAKGVARAAFGYGGQKCSACSRVLVDRRVKSAFIEKLVGEARGIRIGDPWARDVSLGPLISVAAVRTYSEAVQRVRKSKGRILTGGGTPKRPGNFVEPTIVDRLPRDHPTNTEELFVPILSVVEVDGIEDAIRVANDVDYGLTAGIFSRDVDEIRRFFEDVHAGVTYANRSAGATTGAIVGVQPFGGWKMSGISGKAAGGHYYLQQFLREQSRTTYGP